MEKIYTKKQVLEILSIKPSTLNVWMKNGKIEYFKLNEKLVRFRESELKRLMEG